MTKIHYILHVVVYAFMFGCGPLHADRDQTSEASISYGSVFGDSYRLFGGIKIKPRDPLVASFSNIGKKLRESLHESPTGLAARMEFKKFLTEEIIAQEGIIGDQLHTTLREFVRSHDCGGVACSRVFGIQETEIDEVLDKTEQDVAQNFHANTPDKIRAKDILQKSLKRLHPKKILGELRTWFKSNHKNPTELEGTCVIPLAIAYGPRSNGPSSSAIDSSIDDGTIDYRSSHTKYRDQGMTNLCHTFAMGSLLTHTPQKSVSKSKQIDIERTALAMWSDRLGENVTGAIVEEHEFIMNLGKAARQLILEGAQKNGYNQQLVEIYFDKLYHVSKMHKQGGTAEDNFKFFSRKGAVISSPTREPLDMKVVEELTSKLSKARFRLILKVIQDNASLSERDIKQSIGPILDEIWALTKKEASNLDQVVAKELTALEMVTVKRPLKKSTDIIQDLKNALKDYGPLYISANGHATTIVAYSEKERYFWVTNSAHEDKVAYSPLDTYDLALTFDHYSYIKPRSSP